LKNIRILAYHKVNDSGTGALDVPVKNFEQQMEYLKIHRYNVISLDELVEKLRNKKMVKEKSVVLTFDDGHRDNYTFAYPVLKKYNFPATIFLTTSYIGSKDFLSWEQIGEMSGEKFPEKNRISFGAHTATHPHLTRISLENARDEIKKSKEIIEDKTGILCSYFCYPYGDMNEEIKKIVQECGYIAAVVTPPRSGIKEDIFCLKRVGIYRHTTMLQFRLKLWGFYSWIKNR